MRPVSPPRDKYRELWLAEAGRVLVAEFELVTPPLVIRTDVNMRGGTGPAVGLCWDDSPKCRIDVAAELQDEQEILAVLLHELAHAEVGPLIGHNGRYRPLHRAVGFVGKPTGYETGLILREDLRAISRRLGSYPSAAR